MSQMTFNDYEYNLRKKKTKLNVLFVSVNLMMYANAKNTLFSVICLYR